jgi:hypothetical protein
MKLSTTVSEARDKSINAARTKADDKTFNDIFKSELKTELGAMIEDSCAKMLAKAVTLLGGVGGKLSANDDAKTIRSLRLSGGDSSGDALLSSLRSKPGKPSEDAVNKLAADDDVDDLRRTESDSDKEPDETYSSRRSNKYLNVMRVANPCEKAAAKKKAGAKPAVDLKAAGVKDAKKARTHRMVNDRRFETSRPPFIDLLPRRLQHINKLMRNANFQHKVTYAIRRLM